MGLLDRPQPSATATSRMVLPGLPSHVVAEWTANELNLGLLDDRGFSVQSLRGPGLRATSGAWATTLSAILADWDLCHGALPLTVCGLSEGLAAGWPGAEPLLCPIPLDRIPRAALHFAGADRSVALVPGLSCLSRMGSTDQLCGEETVLLGATILNPDLLRGTKTVCIPGPRTRWIMVRQGNILHFTTSVTGEVFRLLHDDGALGSEDDGAIQPDAFDRGMQEAAEHADVDLLHLLHQARCRHQQGEIAPTGTASFVLGLLIRRDVAVADDLLRLGRRSSVVLIADESYPYARAFAAHGISVTAMERTRAAVAGLFHIAQTAHR